MNHLSLGLKLLKSGFELLSPLIVLDFLSIQDTLVPLVLKQLLVLEMVFFGFGRDTDGLGNTAFEFALGLFGLGFD